ncbi:MAG TPA: PIG-L family deacetylase [Chryseosolibacter sp.]|nr:PIG-L family deacetylase [Chryseosolibacter sp.]
MRKFFLAFICIPFLTYGQPLQQPDAAQLKLKLKKLNFLGSVLYMAAHPDDENTRIITYLANGRLATTAYLSLTRGDGGQNLIGSEIRDLLGVIRTQELLAARKIDGGQQFFTRAIDFGFSKSAEETFTIWPREEVLSDVLKVFREYQPDVIITRFPADEQRANHGHHTASAMLAHEAFDLAARADVLPDQVKTLGTWQPKRLLTNTGRWWNDKINEKPPGVITIDVGAYSPLLGKSFSEIAAQSGSQHKSQGWGQQSNRGYMPEFLEQMKGEKAEKDIFEGVNTTWTRVKGGEKVATLLERAIREFDEENPAASLPLLLQVRNAIKALEDGVWKRRKLTETEQLITEVLGIFLNATASHYHGSPGEKMKSTFEIINRSSSEVTINRIASPTLNWDSAFSLPLVSNVKTVISSTASLKTDLPYSEPYWLAAAHDIALFKVKQNEMIGAPENRPAVEFVFSLSIGGEPFEIRKPLVYKWVDPVKGELWRPFEIVPPVFVNMFEKVVVFNSQQPKELRLLLRSSVRTPMAGTLSLTLPAGWRAEPASVAFDLAKAGDEISRVFQVYPSSDESRGMIRAVAEINGKKYDQALQYIDYDHIPIQTLLPEAQVNVVRIDLKKDGRLIGYIRGAGDEIPSALRNMGYEVWEMKNEEVTPENLKKVDAVVMGIRAVNTNPRIRYFMADLLNYVKEGGTLVMQYNTSFDFEVETFSPFPLKLGRDRVTEENAEVRILKPEHPVFNTPNKITAKDFDGWVQERGLYFPTTWDPAFEALLSMNDKKDTPKDGSLLVAKYGTGHYVYTGLSFFRELPEGIPGAYKLFANLVSLGKTTKPESSKQKGKKRI